MVTVHYPISLSYRPVSGPGFEPALEVWLFYGERSAGAIGVLDSASSVTVFSPEIAQLLGIEDVRAGKQGRASTLGGPIDYYLFDNIEIEVRLGLLRNRFPGQVGFFAASRPRNILGRNLLFTHYQIGFRERNQQIHLRPEG